MLFIHRIALSALVALFAAACGSGPVTLAGDQPPAPGGGTTESPPGDADPCAGKDLPACPPACTPDAQPGKACSQEGAECGNNIGDGCRCETGAWRCSVHPPLGPRCNQICK